MEQFFFIPLQSSNLLRQDLFCCPFLVLCISFNPLNGNNGVLFDFYGKLVQTYRRETSYHKQVPHTPLFSEVGDSQV